MHTIVATNDIYELSANIYVGHQAKSFSIDFSSTGYSIEPTFDEDVISPSSQSVEFDASYSFQFSPDDNSKDEDSSSGNLSTSTFSLEFSSDATSSSSLPYLRRE
jgi:hypothetical protein